jgi:hypothetical protein
MNRFALCIAFIFICALAASGCAGTGAPLSPDQLAEVTREKSVSPEPSQTHLWGLYDIYIDVDAMTAVAIPDRGAMFTANVVNFLNGKTTNMGFKINNIDTTTDYTDIDIDVTLKHPFPGLPQYNGYDVRGVFMGDGSATMAYNSDLKYPVDGTDQIMLANPGNGHGGPDGYTRWFNKPEFSSGGMPLMQYTSGKLATPGYSESATINGYKYFADGLSANDDLWNWFNANASQHGVFSSGVANTRNYYLRFPSGKGITFAYAVIANWEGPTIHPSNAAEAVGVKVVDNSTVYYVSPSDNGGNVKLDVSVWDWGSQLTGGVMEDYTIKVESTVLSSPWTADSTTMTPIGGDVNFSTYQLDIPADNVTGTEGQSYWVIVEEKDSNYTNDFGVANLADQDPLAAFFPYPLEVGDQSPVCPIPDPTAILPGSGPNTAPLDVTITCSNLFHATGISAYLDMSGAIDGTYDIAATNVTNVNVAGGTFDCTFDLTGKPLGSYYVIVSNECGETGASATTIFTVIENLEGDFYVSNHTDFNGQPEEGTMQHPFHTIQKALDAADADGTDNDLILVDYGQGRYPEIIHDSIGYFNLRAYNWHSPSGRPAIGGLDVVFSDWSYYGTITFDNCIDITIQGFKLLFVANTNLTYHDIYKQYAGKNVTIRDCWFSGDTRDGASYCAAITIYFVDGNHIENNLFKGINMVHPIADGSGCRIYAIDFQVQKNIYILRNEFTQFQWTGPSDGQPVNLHTGYEGGTYGNFQVNNNLYHHIWPTTSDAASFDFTGENYWDYYQDYQDPDYPFEVAFNTYDNINTNGISNSTATGINSYMDCPLLTIHSNILTNGFVVHPMYGIANYSSIPADYNNLWNNVLWSSGQGTGNISADPKYVNNTSAPYDYHLQSGSPCIGTGKGGEDMGCYGNLGPGEKVGLLTPEN